MSFDLDTLRADMIRKLDAIEESLELKSTAQKGD